jgi:hypothetical protein
MIAMKLFRSYLDWQIVFYKTQAGWKFEASQNDDVLTDDLPHPTIELANVHAYFLIQAHRTQLRFGQWVEGLRSSNQITQAQYEQAIALTAEMTTSFSALPQPD